MAWLKPNEKTPTLLVGSLSAVLSLSFESHPTRSRLDLGRWDRWTILGHDWPPTTMSTDGIGPSRFTMTLFQSLANSAGYDPVAGLGSSCNSPGSRSRCVIPFGAGERIRSVDSLTLIANGLSFAVRLLYKHLISTHHCVIKDGDLSWPSPWMFLNNIYATDYDHNLYHFWRLCGLWSLW